MNESLYNVTGMRSYEIVKEYSFLPNLTEITIPTGKHVKKVEGYVLYPLAVRKDSIKTIKEGRLFLKDVWSITYLPSGRLWGNLDYWKHTIDEVESLMRKIVDDLETISLKEVYKKYEKIL